MHRPARIAAALALAWADTRALAQSAGVPATLPAVTVTANPLGSELFELVAPAAVVDDRKLRRNLAPNLGDTLSNEVGVTSSAYGPNAGRPIIRGLDGDRIRILQNGVGVLDASATSVDHAVAVDPLAADRIEIVRGPAALLYGGNAVGGVVNVIDGRIASESPGRGVGGALDLRYGGAALERSQSLRLDAGGDGLALHLDAFNRRTGDLRIPGFARSRRERERNPLAAGEEEPRDRLVNSAAASEGGGLGLTVYNARGYNGVSVAQTSSRYGTVAESDVRIGLEQTRYDFAGEHRPGGLVKALRYKIGYTDYQHIEYAAETTPGTKFSSNGFDSRIEAVHERIGRFDGALGVQLKRFTFSAMGAEGFLPVTATRSAALFLYEETTLGPLKLSGGARGESVRVGAEEDPRFGDARTRSFAPRSGSLGALYTLSREYAVAFSGSYTERALTYQELFANGRHLATRAFEVGDATLGKERSTAFDLALRKQAGPLTGSLGVFYNRFRDFVTLVPTGADDGDPDHPLPVYAYRHLPAAFRGAEATLSYIAYDRGGRRIVLEARADTTRATDRSTGRPLPRIAPVRVGAAVAYSAGPLGARLDVLRVGAQHRVAENELPTDAYTMVDATLTYALRPGMTPAIAWEAFLKGTNLLNEEARTHTSFLKDVAPLGRRAVVLGLRGTF